MGPPPSPKTPRRVFTPKSDGGGFSQESPLNIPRIETTPTPGWQTPKGPFHIDTPETPYGQVLRPNPSPETRKNWKRWIDNFPDLGREKKTPPVKRRNSTPLSELKRRCWDMILPKKNPEQDTAGTNQCVKDPTSSAKLEKEVAEFNDYLNQQLEEPDKPMMKRMRTSDVEAPPDIENVPVNLGLLGKDSQGVVEWMDPIEIRKGKPEETPVVAELEQIETRSFRFMLSGIQEREEFEEKIKVLGGKLTVQILFDHTATHLLCNRPVRSEKLLASIASGKWILHRSFLDASQKANKFLKEDEYEWGNPSAITLMRDLKPGSLEHDLALAAHRWRCKLSKDHGGAFVGVRALVCISREREEPFKRLILAGGGQVLNFSNLKAATHCFVELHKVALPIDLSILVKNRIPCVAPVYLNDYLIKNPPPQAHNCLVPEYQSLMQS
ncbi:hypothetical protein C0J52_04214 [Blattella germanica]|nr:hypothetical protein C0J52_04214 [Blattella germanica]